MRKKIIKFPLKRTWRMRNKKAFHLKMGRTCCNLDLQTARSAMVVEENHCAKKATCGHDYVPITAEWLIREIDWKFLYNTILLIILISNNFIDFFACLIHSLRSLALSSRSVILAIISIFLDIHST
jgi:hypothetical protein